MADPADRTAAGGPRPRGNAGAFVVLMLVCAAVLGFTAAQTKDRIAQNHQRQFYQTITALTGQPQNVTALQWHDDMAYLCDGSVLLRGAASGYGGPIVWLAAVDPASGGKPDDGAAAAASTLEGVRISAHQETPGIADFLNHPGQGWLAGLAGRSAAELAGVDGVSGATITSRALLRDLSAALHRVDDPAGSDIPGTNDMSSPDGCPP